MAGKNTNPDRVISNHVDGFKQGVKTFLAVLLGVPVMMMAGSPVAVAAVPDTISSQTVSTIHKAKAYSPMQLNFLSATDILPIVGQVEAGDKKAYEHIEHLGIAEATKIRDMMWEYGAGSYSPQEYQQLMSRLHTGMTREKPEGYDNYEHIGGSGSTPSNHATNEWNILNSIIDDKANFIVQNGGSPWWGSIKERVDANPNHIYIFGNSIYGISDKAWLLTQNSENLKSQLARSKNFLIFAAGTNISEKNENGERILKNKIYHEDINGDENGEYSLPSFANGSKNKDPNNHVMVTIGTNKNGNADKTSNNTGSKVPVGFSYKSLWAGRSFPYSDNDYGAIVGDGGNYATSYTNYVNVAMASLCFQMGADIEDVDALLDRMRTTALTDYIRFDLNGDGDTDDIVQVDTDDGHIDQPETQPLQLISPAGVFKKYNMPQELPTEIKIGETLPLNKHFYNGVAFLIAGAEVCINGQWIAFSNENSTLVMAENPMTLQWRLNGELMQQYGYSDGDTIEGSIVAVDDEWNGLNHLSKTFSVMLKGKATGVGGIEADSQTATSNVWYTISGQKLSKRPTTPGVYIRNGKKLVVK